MANQLPPGLDLVRTTDSFDDQHHPAGLRRAHRVARGVWARLIVDAGTVTLVFEDDPAHPIICDRSNPGVIPPSRQHHVEFDGPARFALEFHRDPAGGAEPTTDGNESTGLDEG